MSEMDSWFGQTEKLMEARHLTLTQLMRYLYHRRMARKVLQEAEELAEVAEEEEAEIILPEEMDEE